MNEQQRKAMELALYALEDNFDMWTAKTKAITAIKEALAQDALQALHDENKSLGLYEQEPVAWESLLGAVARGWCYEANANKTMDSDLAVAIAKEVHALYTTPPQRKPLTDEQIKEALADMSALQMPFNKLIPAIARAIEAAHGIKGEA